jgi:hypothetical protein
MGMQGILGTQRGNEIIATVTNKNDPGLRDVYFGMTHFTSYREDDREAKKILVGFLGNAGVRKKAISDAFEMNPCLVTRYSKNMRQAGISSLLEDRRGRPSKVTEEIGAFVRKHYEQLRKREKRGIRPTIKQKVKQRFGVEISRELIRQITIPVRQEPNLSRQPYESRGNLLPLFSSKGLAVTIDHGTNGLRLLKALEVGFYSRYAAELLLNVFVARLTEGILQGYEDSQTSYDLRSFMIMIIQMVQFDIVNIERVKRINRREFGVLLGVGISPSLKTMRRKLNQAVERLDMEKISMRLAQNYLRHLSLGTDVFYVDDHLDTYSGKHKVLQGFSHVYDRMMEGIQHTFVHDRWGNPICFELRDNFNHFREYLPVMVKRVKGIYRGRRKPTFVFDRFGYDKKLFAQFDKPLGAYYIVWAKGDKTDYEREPLEFDEVEFHFRRNIPGRPRKVIMGIAELPGLGAEGKQRTIVLRRKTTRRIKEKKGYMYSSLVTNDTRRSKQEIVEHLIYRWREECDFKVEVNEFGIDQITSYMMEDYREDIFSGDDLLSSDFRQQKMMQNPMLRPLRWRKGKVKQEIAKIDQQIGKWAIAQAKNGEKTLSEAVGMKRNRVALERRGHLLRQLEEIEKKMASLPKRANRLECLIYGKFKRFNFSKKLIMDTLKVCARNVRKMALELFDHHYQNYRDQLDFLRRIIRNGGHIKLNRRGMVIVDIVPFDTKAENEVLTNFLKEINSAKPRMFGDNPFPIRFRVGRS